MAAASLPDTHGQGDTALNARNRALEAPASIDVLSTPAAVLRYAEVARSRTEVRIPDGELGSVLMASLAGFQRLGRGRWRTTVSELPGTLEDPRAYVAGALARRLLLDADGIVEVSPAHVSKLVPEIPFVFDPTPSGRWGAMLGRPDACAVAASLENAGPNGGGMVAVRPDPRGWQPRAGAVTVFDVVERRGISPSGGEEIPVPPGFSVAELRQTVRAAAADASLPILRAERGFLSNDLDVAVAVAVAGSLGIPAMCSMSPALSRYLGTGTLKAAADRDEPPSDATGWYERAAELRAAMLTEHGQDLVLSTLIDLEALPSTSSLGLVCDVSEDGVRTISSLESLLRAQSRPPNEVVLVGAESELRHAQQVVGEFPLRLVAKENWTTELLRQSTSDVFTFVAPDASYRTQHVAVAAEALGQTGWGVARLGVCSVRIPPLGVAIGGPYDVAHEGAVVVTRTALRHGLRGAGGGVARVGQVFRRLARSGQLVSTLTVTLSLTIEDLAEKVGAEVVNRAPQWVLSDPMEARE